MKDGSPNSRSLEKANPDRRRATAIDWTQVHQRLDAAQADLERRTALDSDEVRSILRTRAKLLAKEPEGEERPVGSLEVVEFLLAHEHYAFESRYIREIQPLRDLTPLPCTPAFVLGVINVRGQILSVIDIKKVFDPSEKGLTDLTKVIVVQTDRMKLGILASGILGVRSITLGDLQFSLPTFTNVGAKFLRGVTKDSVAVLDVERILSDRSILVEDDASSAI